MGSTSRVKTLGECDSAASPAEGVVVWVPSGEAEPVTSVGGPSVEVDEEAFVGGEFAVEAVLGQGDAAAATSGEVTG